MKQLLLLFPLLAIWGSLNAQLSINIHVKQDNNVNIFLSDQNGVILDSAKLAQLNSQERANVMNAKLITVKIINDNKNDDGFIIFKSSGGAPTSYSFSFGKNGDKRYPTGELSISFNLMEKLSWAAGQSFSFPCQLLVQDKERKLIGKSLIKLTDNQTGQGNSDGNKNPLLLKRGTYAGIAYYDALTLAKCENLDKSILLGILNFYNGQTRDTNILLKYSNNPFISSYLKDNITCFKPEKQSMSKFNFSSLAGQVGNLDVTNFADGLAKFLVERTKTELNSYFFKRFKSDLDQIPQLSILFPFTFQALKSIDKNIYNYSAYINLLRDCFQKDLALLLPNLQKLVDDPCMDQIFAANPILRTILSDGLFIINDLRLGTHPGEVLHNYASNHAKKAELSAINPNLYPGFQTLDLLSQSLRTKSAGQYWVGIDSLKLLMNDTLAFKIYLGLIYQQADVRKISFNGNVPLTAALLKAGNVYDSVKKIYEPYLTGLIEKGKRVDYCFNLVLQKNGQETDKPTYQDYYSLYDASLNLLEHLKNGNRLIGIKFPERTEKNLNLFFFSARTAGNIYVDVYEKQYSSAIVELSVLFDSLFSKKNLPDPDHTKYGRIGEASSLIMKYGGLAAAIVKAENSDDVEKAIEAYSLPAGSSSVKRESQFNVSLNGYVGVFAGHEFINGAPDSLFVNNYGISAPVGVSVSWGGLKCNPIRGGHSLGFFVSVIDIGALASFRFGDDSTSTVPTIQLGDIIAPGLFLSWGIAGTPFSLSAGAQIGPLLRNVAPSVNTFSDNYYWRFGATFTVDIPILNFYNKGKKTGF